MDIRACAISLEKSLADAIVVIDRAHTGLALAVDTAGALHGVISDGDIRRALLAGAQLTDLVRDHMVSDPITLREPSTPADIDAVLASPAFQARQPRWIPVVDRHNKPVALYLTTELANLRADQAGQGHAEHDVAQRVTVLGGAGYIGSVLVRQLLEDGYRVRAFDQLFYGRASLAEVSNHPRFELVVGDVRQTSALVAALIDSDVVVHLAELVGDPLCAHNPVMTFEINYLSTVTIALACQYLQINRFVYISSCSVYGASREPETILTEESPLSPVSLYAKLKIEAEQSLLQMSRGGFSPTILRLGTVFGLSPRPRFDLVVNTLTAQAVQDGAITVFGGDQWRPHVHVSDVARAIRRCLALPLETIRGEVFNIVTENLTVDDVARLVIEEVPTATLTRSDTVVDRRNYRVSAEKARRILGFDPQVSVRDGIREVATALTSSRLASYTNPAYSNILTFTTKGFS
jgi:nucleoside-diphosphate-sugar epimerase